VLAYLQGIDGFWDPKEMEETAEATFLKLQECWQSREYGPMRALLMPDLYNQHLAQINSLKRDHEIDMIEGLKVSRVEIVQVRYHLKKDQQEFTVLFEATARDYYVDDESKEFLRGDTSPAKFQEFWVFQRWADKWLLREIDQTRESDALRAENFVEDLTPQQLKNIYGDAATVKEKAPWLDESVSRKGEKIHRMLNFLARTDSNWDEEKLKEVVRRTFIGVLTSLEDRDVAQAQDSMTAGMASALRKQTKKMVSDSRTVEYRNMCVRKVDIVLVRNYSDNKKDTFTARVSAHAQTIDKKGNSVLRQDEYVSPFENYLTFRKVGGQWKLDEFEPPSKAQGILTAENVDEDSSPEQVRWYYTKDRAL